MVKAIALKRQIPWLLTATAILISASPSARAQEDVNGKYKVGDRVECDHQSGGGEYKKGRVVEVNGAGSKLTCCRYRVKFDNDDPLWADGRLCSDSFIRRPGGATSPEKQGSGQTGKEGNPPNKGAGPAQTDRDNFDYLADRKILECPIEQKPVSPAALPQEELLKKVVRCLFERHAPKGITGATTVDISAFQIGTPRPWVPRSDIGSGNLKTTVHPIKVTWTLKKFYESFTRVEENISIFNCYVNAVGEWECGLGQRIKEGEAKNIPR